MGQDISHLLEGWDFDPHELNVRVITGDDGQPKIQMRIDLGLLQMSMSGRPDGARPNDCDSLLDYYEKCANEYGEGYTLSDDAIDCLFREGWQFYHRYLCLFHLGRYDLVVRDTERNLRLFVFIRQAAKRRRDKWRFDQYRPYVLMMHTRALGMMALQDDNTAKAVEQIEHGRERIIEFLQEYDRPSDDGNCFELEFLTRWREELSAGDSLDDINLDEVDDLESLRTQLQKAISLENYEYAAIIRDQIKRQEQSDPPPSS